MSRGPNPTPSQIPARRPRLGGDAGQSLHLPLSVVGFFCSHWPEPRERDAQAAGWETTASVLVLSDPCLSRGSSLQRVQGGSKLALALSSLDSFVEQVWDPEGAAARSHLWVTVGANNSRRVATNQPRSTFQSHPHILFPPAAKWC